MGPHSPVTQAPKTCADFSSLLSSLSMPYPELHLHDIPVYSLTRSLNKGTLRICRGTSKPDILDPMTKEKSYRSRQKEQIPASKIFPPLSLSLPDPFGFLLVSFQSPKILLHSHPILLFSLAALDDGWLVKESSPGLRWSGPKIEFWHPLWDDPHLPGV